MAKVNESLHPKFKFDDNLNFFLGKEIAAGGFGAVYPAFVAREDDAMKMMAVKVYEK
jgi:hypothetical protein